MMGIVNDLKSGRHQNNDCDVEDAMHISRPAILNHDLDIAFLQPGAFIAHLVE